MKDVDRTVRFRLDIEVSGHTSVQLGHAVAVSIVDGRWEVRDPAGIHRGIGRHPDLEVAVLDYIRKSLAGEVD